MEIELPENKLSCDRMLPLHAPSLPWDFKLPCQNACPISALQGLHHFSHQHIFLREKYLSLFKERAGPSKTQFDYCFVRRNQTKFLKDIKILPREECITKHQSLVFDFKIRIVKVTRRNFLARRKIWKPHKDCKE